MKRKRTREKARAAAAGTAPSPATPVLPAALAAKSLPEADRIDALTKVISGELGQLRGEIRGRDADLVDALQRVAASYDRMADQLEHDRRVQALLAEALVRIDRRIGGIETGRDATGREIGRPKREELPRGPRVIGGSIAPRQDVSRVDR